MNALIKIFSTDFFSALSWTLVHSLWQGLVIALLAGIMIITSKKSTSARRYNFLAFLLFLFISGVAVTFFTELQLQSKDITGTVEKTVYGSQIIIDHPSHGQVTNTSQLNALEIWQNISSYVDSNSQMIVLCWFLFFLVNFIRLGSGLLYIHRLRYRQNYPVEQEWINRLKELSDLAAVRVPVLFLQSELVKVPVVIGMLKPVILVPIGLLVNLSAPQVETILLHELAHIRRRDYLVNLVQTLATTIFFFNPALLWISSLLREEREACCDDIVIGLTTDKTTYLEALVSFQEYSMEKNLQAMALGGHKNFLLKRVSRMLTQENKKLNFMEKTVLLAGVAGLMAFSIIQQPTEKLLFREPVKTESQVQPAKPATPAQPGKHVTPVQPGKPATPVLKESKALLPVTAKPESVYLVPAVKVVPGVAVPDTVPNNPVSPENKNNFPNISSSTNDDGQTKTTRIEATDQTGKKYKINKINDKITELYVDGVAIPENQFNKYNDVIEQIEDQRHTNALVARKRLEEVRRKNLIEREVRTKEREVRLKEDRAVRSQELQEKRLKVEKERNARATQERAVRKTILVNNATNREISSIINELTSAKVIEDRDNLSFSLNNESLVVNGKKQPSELHEKLRGKYIQKSGDKYIYSKKGNTTNVTINKE